MCVIVDACVRDRIFSAAPKEDAVPVRQWILEKGGKVAYGGTKLTKELTGSEHARRELKSWAQAGLVHQLLNAEVDAKATELERACKCRSNDAHVIALAIMSGARVLYSFDTNSHLHEDFKNKTLIDSPGGVIYQSAEHRHLLVHSTSCGQAAKKKSRK